MNTEIVKNCNFIKFSVGPLAKAVKKIGWIKSIEWIESNLFGRHFKNSEKTLHFDRLYIIIIDKKLSEKTKSENLC